MQPPLRAVGAQLTEEELKALRKEDKARMKAELAARLNAEGFTNRDGRPWSRVTARNLAVKLARQQQLVGAAS